MMGKSKWSGRGVLMSLHEVGLEQQCIQSRQRCYMVIFPFRAVVVVIVVIAAVEVVHLLLVMWSMVIVLQWPNAGIGFVGSNNCQMAAL